MNIKCSSLFMLSVLYTLLYSNILTQELILKCDQGCVSCSTEKVDECQICDLFNFFIRDSEGKCTKREIDNCEVASINPNRSVCVLCEPGYIVDFVQGKCASVHFSKLIDECERYTSFSSCDTCNPGNFMERGVCSNTTTVIENCERYSKDGFCSSCKDDYFLSLENNSCSQFPKIKNCSNYNRNKCEECKPGFTKDYNFYLNVTANDKTGESLALSERKNPQIFSVPDDNCFKNQVENCETFLTPTKCGKCEDNFFLTHNFTCEAFPINKIKNCEIYESDTNCKKCNELNFVENGKCEARENLDDNCVVYKTNMDECAICGDEFFLKTDNNPSTCEKRTLSVQNCIEYEIESDNCLNCKPNYLLAIPDKNECFLQPENCQEVQNDSSISNFKTCNLCADGYFHIGGDQTSPCEKIRHLAHCEDEDQLLNTCTTCSNGFYKDNQGICHPHTAKLCATFESDLDECVSCISGYKKTNKVCTPITSLENCQQETDSNNCNNCDVGYYKSDDNKCLLKNLVGCLTQKSNENLCNTCDEDNGFFLGDDDLCYFRKIANCENLTLTSHGCTNCVNGYYVNDFGTCSKDYVSLDNCATAGNNENGKCVTCDDENNFYLNPISNECLSRLNTSCSSYDKYSDTCTDCSNLEENVGGVCRTYVEPNNCLSSEFYSPLNRSICTVCETGFFLTKSKTCAKQNIEGCSSYEPVYGCNSCETGFILNQFTKVCEKIYIPNCKTYSNSNFECSECEDTFFLNFDKRCYRLTIEGCQELKTNINNGCNTCVAGYTLITEDSYSLCVPEEEAQNCKILKHDDRTKCSVCDEDYYLTTNNDCDLNDVDNNPDFLENCLVMDLDGTSCSICRNLYYHVTAQNPGECDELSDTNCIESDGINDKCDICSPGYKLEQIIIGAGIGPFQCTLIVEDLPLDIGREECYGNNKDNDSYCGICNPGFMTAKIFNANLIKLPGCEVVDVDEGGLFCFQCYEMYENDPNSRGCIPLNDSYTGECIKAFTLVDSMSEIETNNRECLVCRNRDTHFTSETGCQERTNLIPNCELYSEDSDECEKSLKNSISTPSKKNSFACLEIDSSLVIQNCSINSFDYVFNDGTKKCEICQFGYKGTDCGEKVKIEELYFDENANVSTKNISTNPGSNVKRSVRGPNNEDSDSTARQFNINYTGECEDGYIPVIYDFESYVSGDDKYPYYTTFDPVLKKHDPIARFSAIKECIDSQDDGIDWVGKGDTDYPSENIIRNNLCALASMRNNKYFCISCKFGMIGKFYSHGDLNGSTDFTTIVECANAGEYGLERKYLSGIGSVLKNLDITAVTEYDNWGGIANFIHYDSCSDSSKYPIIYLDLDPVTNTPEMRHDGTSTEPIPVMECTDLANDYATDNCAVYSVKVTDKTSTDFTMTDYYTLYNDIGCIKCKPGYYNSSVATNTVAGNFGDLFVECSDEIVGCDIKSPENNIMGYCNKCLDGFTRYVNKDTLLLDRECTEEIDDPNCYVSINGATDFSCILCKAGYYLDYNGICVQKNDIYCDEMGIQNILLEDSTSDFRRFGILELGYILEKQNIGKSTTGCQKCSLGFALVKIDDNLISHGLYETAPESIQGCLIVAADFSCLKCEDEYTLVVDENEKNKCALTSTDNKYKGCFEYKIDDTDGDECTYYKFPYYLLKHPLTGILTPTYVGNTDVKFFISHRLSNPVVCITGYIFDFAKQMCIAITDDDPCNKYHCEEDYNYCVCFRCKHTSQSSVTYKYNNDGKGIYKVKCYTPSNVSKMLQSSHTVVLAEDSSDNPFGMLTQCISYEYSSPNVFSQINLSYVNDNVYCVPEIRTELNCLKYHDYKYECVSCHEEFYLNDFNHCIRGQILNCEHFDDKTGRCLKCQPNYYFNPIQIESEICLPYTVECEIYAPNYNGCLSCPPYLLQIENIVTRRRILSSIETSENSFISIINPISRILATTDNDIDNFIIECVSYTVDNCFEYNKYEDSCVICMEGYYRDLTDSICKPIEVAYCSVYDLQSAACLHCNEGFYLDETQNCLQVTKKNCLNFSSTKNACLSCPPFFYLDDDQNCEQTMLIGCEIPMVSSNECSKCSSGFFKDSNNKCITYTAMHCSIYEDGEDKCFLCDEGTYKDESSGNCVQYTNAVNCESYNSNKDECVTCPSAFYLDSQTKNCKEITSVFCEKYSLTEDKCATCLENYYLASDFNCAPVSALNCLTSSPIENKCETCSQEFFLDNESGNCEPYTVFNCQYYNLFKDSCASCKYGYYMNEGSCLPYLATNCSSYSASSDKCNSCIEGFYINSLTELCTPYTAVGCSSFNPREDSCISCPPDFFQSSSGCSSYTVKNCFRRSASADLCLDCQNGFYFEKGHCLPYTVQNCLLKDTSKDLCLSCQNGYFFEFGICYPYTVQNCETFMNNKDQCETCDYSLNHGHVYSQDNKCLFSTEVENCVRYSTDDDSCLECEYGFYVKENICHPNPTGIPNCNNYLNINECGGCEPSFFLKDNSCQSPLAEISECEIYTSETICEKCTGNYSPNEDGLCAENFEQSCLENENPSSCKTCKKGDVLVKNENNLSTCINSGLSFCQEVVQTVSGVECLQCDTGYYKKNGKCESPTEIIEFCEEYLDDGLCSKCSENHVLLSNKKLCSGNLNLVGLNCSKGSITPKPYCSRCDGGFFFNSSGNCVQCSEDLIGCGVCDLNDMNYCLICQQGYYMNAERNCVLYPETDEPTSFKRLSVAFMLMMMIIFLQ